MHETIIVLSCQLQVKFNDERLLIICNMFYRVISFRKIIDGSPILRSWSTVFVAVIGLTLLIGTLVHLKTQFSTDFGYHQSHTRFLIPKSSWTIDRSKSNCCLSSQHQQDICGRRNCVWPCRNELKPAIPELETDLEKLKYHDGQRAFFIETSGSGKLDYRQACAIESLAHHNPNLTIYVLFIDAEIHTEMFTVQQLKFNYNNIRLISVDINDFVTGTQLEHWYYCTDWSDGQYHVSHLSDGLRFLTLFKYGGYYFDLDVIQVRPVTYYRNFVAEESIGITLGSCALHADYGHPLMKLATKEFTGNYRADLWVHNGPDLLRRVLLNWCDVEDIASMNYVECKGFNVLPFMTFNPIDYVNYAEFFMDRPANDNGDLPFLTSQVVGVHVWNKLSWDEEIYKNSKQYYSQLARLNCPSTFAIAPDVY